MDRFLVLTTTTDQKFANRLCEIMEQADIPVMLEHIEVHDRDISVSGYRLLVPSQYSQGALRMVNAASCSYYQEPGSVKYALRAA